MATNMASTAGMSAAAAVQAVAKAVQAAKVSLGVVEAAPVEAKPEPKVEALVEVKPEPKVEALVEVKVETAPTTKEIFVTQEQAQSEEFRKKGMKSAGLYEFTEWVDQTGATRYRADHLESTKVPTK